MSGSSKKNQPSNPNMVSTKRDNLTNIFSDCPQKKYGINQPLFSPLDDHKYVYFLLQGKVKVTNISKKGRLVSSGYYKEGDFVNLQIISNKQEKSVAAISKSKSTNAIKIAKSIFLQKISLLPKLQQQIFNQLLNEKSDTEQRIHRILDIKSNGRVYDFLYHHALKFGQRVGYEYVIRDPLTHQEIGEYIGSSRQTVTTSMNILRRMGILHFNRKYWIIRDLSHLKEIIDAL